MVNVLADLIGLLQQLIDFYHTGSAPASAINNVIYKLLSVLVQPHLEPSAGDRWPLEWAESTRTVKAQVKRWQELF
jgi:hypothetical protein